MNRDHQGIPPRMTVFALIDALGWQFLEGREFLTDLLPYRTPLRTVLGFSSGAIPTILTGRPPAENGHWNLFYYDPEGSPFRWLRHFDFLPDRVLENRATRKLLKELGRRILGLGPLFECCVSTQLLPWFNWVEKRNIYERGGIAGSSSIFDRLTEARVPYRVYSYHQATDAEILRRAERDIRSRQASFFFLYLSELDMFLHLHCNEPDQVEERLRWYDRGLRQVFDATRRVDPDSTFTVVSDHGMTPVGYHFDLVKEVEGLSFNIPEDYLAVYDSTMARFWFFSERARSQITNHLVKLSCGRVVPEDELRQLGVLFADRHYGELIFLLHPGWLISRSDFNGNGWMPAGMHGYHPDDPYSDAVYLANRQPSQPVNGIADVYESMLRATELEKT